MTQNITRHISPAISLIIAATGWLLFFPLTLIIKRNPRLVVFFGRDGGRYIDNCKHLFAAFNEYGDADIKAVFLAKSKSLRNEIRSLGGKAATVGGFEAWRLWLTAGTIVVDNIDWPNSGRFPASRGAKLIQLWHGIPLKHIQLTLFRSRLKHLPKFIALALRVQKIVTGRYVKSDMFLSTSKYITNSSFSSAFNYTNVSHAGYPRNDVLMQSGNALAEHGVDTSILESISKHKNDGVRAIGMYAPTFRRNFDDPFLTGKVDLDELSKIASELNMLLLVKLHPWMHDHYSEISLPSILFVKPDSDAYPLMREIDFLITDYSSIFFDYLLRDQPIIFFPYDIDSYLKFDRPMYFDYEKMTPGPKVTNMSGIRLELNKISSGIDNWRNERNAIRNLVFDHTDNFSGKRLVVNIINDIRINHSTKG